MTFRLLRPRLLPALACLLGLGLGSRGLAQTAAQDSPFLPAPGSGPAAASAGAEPFQLSGISVVGKKTYVSIYDAEKKHGRWIGVGETADGVEVVSCDVKGNQAVVRVAKQLRTLILRPSVVDAGAGGAAAPGAPAAPPPAFPDTPAAAPAPAAPLTEQALQEREARMMVSDLLEIGQQQRKAYEEKKAAAEAAAKKDAK